MAQPLKSELCQLCNSITLEKLAAEHCYYKKSCHEEKYARLSGGARYGFLYHKTNAREEAAERGCRLCALIIKKGQLKEPYDHDLPVVVHVQNLAKIKEQQDLLDVRTRRFIKYPNQLQESARHVVDQRSPLILHVGLLMKFHPRNPTQCFPLCSLNLVLDPDSFLDFVRSKRQVPDLRWIRPAKHNTEIPLEDFDAESITCAESIVKYKKLLGECLRDHVRCPEPITYEVSSAAKFPKRLLDIKPRHGDRCYLVLGQNSRDVYIALSYCWGAQSSSFFKTTKASLQGFEDTGILLSSLPQTILDAVKIARVYGASYIWVDALCIVQDDRREWSLEAAKMAGIYEGALFTLAATSSESSVAGCIYDDPDLTDFIRISSEPSLGRLSVMGLYPPRRRNFQDDVNTTTWNTRGWTLQERFVSARTIHSTSKGPMWECRELRAGERGPSYNIQGPRTEEFTVASFHALNLDLNTGIASDDQKIAAALQWATFAGAFSLRQLTRPTDNLFALQGLINMFEAKTGFSCYYGILNYRLPIQLLWGTIVSMSDVGESSKRHGEDHGRPRDLAPTWSWASWFTDTHSAWQYGCGPFALVHTLLASTMSNLSDITISSIFDLVSTNQMSADCMAEVRFKARYQYRNDNDHLLVVTGLLRLVHGSYVQYDEATQRYRFWETYNRNDSTQSDERFYNLFDSTTLLTHVDFIMCNLEPHKGLLQSVPHQQCRHEHNKSTVQVRCSCTFDEVRPYLSKFYLLKILEQHYTSNNASVHCLALEKIAEPNSFVRVGRASYEIRAQSGETDPVWSDKTAEEVIIL